MKPGDEGFLCFIHIAELPLLPLMDVYALPEGPTFGSFNEDLLLTGLASVSLAM